MLHHVPGTPFHGRKSFTGAVVAYEGCRFVLDPAAGAVVTGNTPMLHGAQYDPITLAINADDIDGDGFPDWFEDL